MAETRTRVVKVNEPPARFTRPWVYDTIERAAKTFVQGFLSVTTMDAFSEGFDPSVYQTFGLGAMAGLFALLTAFARS